MSVSIGAWMRIIVVGRVSKRTRIVEVGVRVKMGVGLEAGVGVVGGGIKKEREKEKDTN